MLIIKQEKKILAWQISYPFSVKFMAILILSLFLVNPQLWAQSEGSAVWKSLQDVTFKTKNDGKYNLDYPVFGSELKKLDGKEITVKGYILPLELGTINTFILSQLPYNMCFFCGGAGPETVIEVNATDEITYSIKPVTIKGKLRLNSKDYNHLMYILDDAVKVEVN